MLTDAFRLTQLPEGFSGSLRVRPSSAAEARAALTSGGSAVVDRKIARLLELALGVPVPADPSKPRFHPEDIFVVADYVGPNIQLDDLKGSLATLPKGARFEFTLIDIGHPEEWVLADKGAS